jgi:hypothetical protein
MHANYFSRFTFTFILLIFARNTFAAGEKEKHKSIQEFLDSKKINLVIKGLGGYQGDCIGLNLENITPDTLFMKVEAGRRFVSADTTEQDIFIVKEMLLALLPMEKRFVKAFGLCCEATMHAPKQNSKFSIGFMTPSAWQSLAKFMYKNNFSNHTMQSAIWVMSNDHQISTVIGDNQKQTDLIRAALSKLKNIPVPWYSLRYAEVAGQVFSDKHERVFGPVEFTLRESALITVQVRDEEGRTMDVPMPASEYANGENTFQMDISVTDWPKGKYTVMVFANGTMRINKKEFIL